MERFNVVIDHNILVVALAEHGAVTTPNDLLQVPAGGQSAEGAIVADVVAQVLAGSCGLVCSQRMLEDLYYRLTHGGSDFAALSPAQATAAVSAVRALAVGGGTFINEKAWERRYGATHRATRRHHGDVRGRIGAEDIRVLAVAFAAADTRGRITLVVTNDQGLSNAAATMAPQGVVALKGEAYISRQRLVRKAA